MRAAAAAALAVAAAGCAARIYAVAPPKDPHDLHVADSANARCSSLADQRRGWQVAAAILSGTSAGGAPILSEIPAADDGARLGLTIGIGVASTAAVVATAVAGVLQESFSSSCAEASPAP